MRRDGRVAKGLGTLPLFHTRKKNMEIASLVLLIGIFLGLATINNKLMTIVTLMQIITKEQLK